MNDLNNFIAEDIENNEKSYKIVFDICNEYIKGDYNKFAELKFDEKSKHYSDEIEIIKSGYKLFTEKKFMVFIKAGFLIKKNSMNFNINGMKEAFEKLKQFRTDTVYIEYKVRV